VRVVTAISKSCCTERPDSSTLCTLRLSCREGLMLLSRHCGYVYHPLNQDLVIESLKASWHSYYKARAGLSIIKKEVDMNILHWRYDCWLENREYLMEEMSQHEGCLHCQRAKCSSCSCIQNLMCWWGETASLLALILSSSAPVERVFSILNQMWSDLQTCALSEIVCTAMFLACNKHSL
jgi:hypothetical protein